jgi:hypothetical protein
MTSGGRFITISDKETYIIENNDLDIVQRLFAVPNRIPQVDISSLEVEHSSGDTPIELDAALTSHSIAGWVLQQNFCGT